MLVKICGVRTAEHALAAATAGADMLGFVFAPSRRQISPAEAALIARALRSAAGPLPRLVGLFVNAEPAMVNAVAAELGLDYVQLSGDEPVAVVEQVVPPIIKSLRLDGSAWEAAWVERAASRDAPAGRVLLLPDAHVPGSYGGTGIVADWGRAAALAARAPLILAGGLTPTNVAAAIAAVGPLGVDVSSGVETDGVKDLKKIEAFIGAARAAH